MLSSLEFTYPLIFLFLPLPYLVYRLIPAYTTKKEAIKAPIFKQVQALLDVAPTSGAQTLKPKRWQKVMMVMTWIAILLSMAKPVWLGPIEYKEVSGRDVMVVVDLSGSMETADFPQLNAPPARRIDALKKVLISFSEQRKSDRLGLILFGDSAYLQSPFTDDALAWQSLLNEADVGMAGQSTKLGDAIGLAIKTLSSTDNQAREKVAIVFTDGNDTGSLVPPLDAAKVAKARDIRIHMVAMGNPETIGESAMDMAVIEGVADITGGKSFTALSQSDLNAINKEIASLEQQLYSSTSYQPKVSIHYIPILTVFLLYLILFYLAMIKKIISQRGEKV